MKMKRNFVLGLVVFALALSIVGCSREVSAGGGTQGTTLSVASQAGDADQPRSISVNGVGLASASPDIALIQLGVESLDTEASLAIADNTSRMTAVMDALKSMQIADEDIQTVNYNMWMEPVYDDQGRPTDQMRFHVVNQIQVKLRDLPKTGELIGNALEAGVNNVGGISFSVADPAQLQSEARDRAIASARAKAEQLAAGFGAQLGSLRQVTEFGGVTAPAFDVRVAEGSGGGGGPVPVSGGAFNVTVEIQATFEIAE
jgi:uncharacterized protein YggE